MPPLFVIPREASLRATSNCLRLSRIVGEVGVPGGAVGDHGIEDDEELALADDEGDLGEFAGGTEALVRRGDGAIPANGGEGCHREDGADGGASTPDGASATQGAAVAGDGGDAD